VKFPDPSLYLTHILESIELAQSYVEGVEYLEFCDSQQLQDAVVRRVEINGGEWRVVLTAPGLPETRLRLVGTWAVEWAPSTAGRCAR